MPADARSQKWAPWWMYLIVLLGANYVRAYVIVGDRFPTFVTVAIALGQGALLFLIITVIWRFAKRESRLGDARMGSE